MKRFILYPSLPNRPWVERERERERDPEEMFIRFKLQGLALI